MKAAEIDEKLAKGEELSPLAGIPVASRTRFNKGSENNLCIKMLETMSRLSMQLK